MTVGQNVQHAILESSKAPCFLGSLSRAVYEAEDDQILKELLLPKGGSGMSAWRVTVCTYSALPIFSKHTIKLRQTSSLPPRCSAIFEQSESPTTPICSLLLASLWERVLFIPSRQRMHVFLRVPSVAITMAAARRAKCCYRPCYFICIAHVTHKCILTCKGFTLHILFPVLVAHPRENQV